MARRFASGLLAILLSLSACAPKATLRSAPPNSETFAPVASPGTAVASVTRVQVEMNGKPGDTSMAFVDVVKGKLEETNLFTAVHGDIDRGPQVVYLHLVMTQDFDVHQTEAEFKAILIQATLGLAWLFVDFVVDLESSVSIEAERWDGVTRSYEAKGAAATLCKVTPCRGEIASDKLTPLLLNDVMRQMIADGAFFAGGR